MSPSELDERHFIHSDTRNLTPFKMSPFARSHMHNRNLPATPHKQDFHSVVHTDQSSNGLEPPHKRVLTSGRRLNYESSS